jgi:hypothetical protein
MTAKLTCIGALLLLAGTWATDIKGTVEEEAAKHQPLRVEYVASRAAVIAALEQVVADNAWHWDKRDDEHGDFRIGIPKSPMWQGRFVVYLASIDDAHQQVTAYRERSGSAAMKKFATKFFTDLQRAIDSRGAKL